MRAECGPQGGEVARGLLEEVLRRPMRASRAALAAEAAGVLNLPRGSDNGSDGSRAQSGPRGSSSVKGALSDTESSVRNT